VVFLAPYDGVLLTVTLRPEYVEIGDSDFLRLKVVILLQTVVELIVTFAVYSGKKYTSNYINVKVVVMTVHHIIRVYTGGGRVDL